MLRTIPRQLALSYIAVILICLALAAAALLGQVRAQFLERVRGDMFDEGQLLATLLTRGGWPPHPGDTEHKLIADSMIKLSLDRITLLGDPHLRFFPSHSSVIERARLNHSSSPNEIGHIAGC